MLIINQWCNAKIDASVETGPIQPLKVKRSVSAGNQASYLVFNPVNY